MVLIKRRRRRTRFSSLRHRTGVDGAIRRIGTTYNTQGLPEKITSYDAASGGSVVNQVKRAYDGLGQLTTEWQANDGAVDTATTPSVQYGYADLAHGSRLTSMTYPNGRVLTYDYGDANSLDDKIGRLHEIQENSAPLERYAYLGLSGVVMRMHPESGIDLTYVGTTTGDAGDQYTGLDRFGRVVDHKWSKSTGVVDQYLYGYDANSNRTYKENGLAGDKSELYAYDSLNRLTAFDRGTLNTAKDGISGTANRSQGWSLDALGNSDSVTTDGTTETRDHNSQNQLTSMGSSTLAFDANGNTTTDQQGRTLIYDAWNRLVEAKDSNGNSLIRYEYDGLTRRVQEGATHQYFSAAWQVLEERDAANQTTASYAWSPVYVDAMIARDRDTDANGSPDERLYVLQDANFNVTAIADTAGNVVERYLYDPYGERTVLDADWATEAGKTSAFAFLHGYQGGKYDSVLTNQMLFRNRVYDVEAAVWLQPDPLDYDDGLNRHRARSNRPIQVVDPSGLADVELHHVIAEWYAHYTTLTGNRADGLRVLLPRIFHRGPGGLETALGEIRRMWRSGEIGKWGSYNRMLLVHIRNLPSIIRANREAVATSGEAGVVFSGGARAAAATLGYTSTGEVALASTGIGIVVAGACVTGHMASGIADADTYRLKMEADMAGDDAAIKTSNYAASVFGDRIVRPLEALLHCPEEKREEVNQCIANYKGQVRAAFNLLYRSKIANDYPQLRSARMNVLERFFPELVRCLESHGCRKK